MFKEIEKKLENAKTIINSWSYEKNAAKNRLEYLNQQKKEEVENGAEDTTWYDEEIEKEKDLLEMFDDVEKYIIKLVKQAI